MAKLQEDLEILFKDSQVPTKVNAWLEGLNPPVTSVIEFAGLACSREAVDNLAKLAGIGDTEISAIGALRRAWLLANAALEKATDIKAGKTVEDVDAPLAEPDEKAVLAAFAKHYNIVLPAYRLSVPGLLGRCVREAEARTFSVTPVSTYRSKVDPAATGKLLKIPLSNSGGPSVGPCLDIDVHSKFTFIRAVRCYATTLAVAGLKNNWCTLSEADTLWEFAEEKAYSRPRGVRQQPSLDHLIDAYNHTLAEIVKQVCVHNKRLGEAIHKGIENTSRLWEFGNTASDDRSPPPPQQPGPVHPPATGSNATPLGNLARLLAGLGSSESSGANNGQSGGVGGRRRDDDGRDVVLQPAPRGAGAGRKRQRTWEDNRGRNDFGRRDGR